MYFIIVLGTAGSGKSVLTAAFADWLEDQQLSVSRVNLDPAAEWLPYNPDFDVRDLVNTREVMVENNLGPNAALIASVDMLINYIDVIRKEVWSEKTNYVIVDTPGQLELFAFRSSGPLVLSAIIGEHKSVSLYLIDAFFALQPAAFVSALLLSSSVMLRFNKPQINVLSKADLLTESEIEKVLQWFEDPIELMNAIDNEPVSFTIKDLAKRLAETITETQLVLKPIPVSSKLNIGLDNLYAEVQRILAGGEDFLTEEPSGRL